MPRDPGLKTDEHALEKEKPGAYNAFKTFEGKRYTGMRIGRGHNWHYDPGVWKETKISPDEWQVQYTVTKRRAGHAPEGSGVPVGTQYHWYIVAHQNVTKLNANEYTTSLVGAKFKLAHKRADKESWSSSPQAQRKKAIGFLRMLADSLEAEAQEEGRKLVPLRPKREKVAKKERRAA